MPTRALGALLAAFAAIAFVVSIVSGAWWDGHPRVDGRVFTAKDVHIGLYGARGCNTGGTGECMPLPVGGIFTAVGYGELGGLALTTAFAILVAAAAWRISDGRKRVAKLGMIFASLAAAGALALIIIGPQIKSSQKVEPPIGWGLLLFGGGIVAMFGGCLATMRLEREPLRLKSPAKQPTEPAFDVREIVRDQHQGLRPTGPMGNLPGPAGPLGAPLFDAAPQLRPLYDVQGAPPTPAAPQLPNRAPTPMPRASAHAIAGLDTPPPELVPPRAKSPTAAPPPRPQSPSTPPIPRSNPPTGAPIPRSNPPSVAPPPHMPAGPRSNSVSAAPPPRPASLSKPPPFSSPSVMPPGTPSVAPFSTRPNAPFNTTSGAPPVPPNAPFSSLSAEASSTPPSGPSSRPSVPSLIPPPDALAATLPAPARITPPPRPTRISVPPPSRVARDIPPLPTPTPSIITSAAKPEAGGIGPRPSQPTIAHSVPPMPAMDVPASQGRPSTENDDRLETAMRETDFVTAVEIDHEAKAKYEEERRKGAGRAGTATGIGDAAPAPQHAASAGPPRASSEDRALIADEGLAAHPHGDVPGDDTDALETTARERLDADAINDDVAPPPQSAPQQPAPSQPRARASQPMMRPAQPSTPNLPISTASPSLPPPKASALPASGPTPACPQCEAPMAWVEEHLRFYCKQCRMYF